jgi:hypothetical protein
MVSVVHDPLMRLAIILLGGFWHCGDITHTFTVYLNEERKEFESPKEDKAEGDSERY